MRLYMCTADESISFNSLLSYPDSHWTVLLDYRVLPLT